MFECIECDKLRLLNFDAVLTDFAAKKAEKSRSTE